MRFRLLAVAAPLIFIAGCPGTCEPSPTANRAAPAAPAPGAGAPAGSQFAATFDTPEDFYSRFLTDVHHRDGNSTHFEQTWLGDHDEHCNGPDTSRVVHGNSEAEAFWWCAPKGPESGHVMVSMGDISGYSITSISPNQVMRNASQVCLDMNVTDLGGRQWIEVVLVPEATFQANGQRLNYISPIAEDVDLQSLRYSSGVIGVTLFHDRTYGWGGHQSNGEQANALAPDGPFDSNVSTTDKATRVQHCITDNRNGTITYNEQPLPGKTFEPFSWWGQFPSEFRVLIKAHTYTPTKDGAVPVGFTWHYDNIIVS